MPHILPLDPHVADLIAAGEVVERPASVVKELLENAIDAGADAVTVEIQNGGMGLIRVTDNGCGIAPEEAETAFLRHATSKLRSERDLEAIGTLGFRGEALAAIAAVARMELLTRVPGAPYGTAVSLEGGIVTGREEAGCPPGSTFLVRDLFYNTPARLKFMKRDAAEGAAVFACVQRLALSHPEVSVKFLRDGRQELLTPGDGLLQSAMYSVLGRDIALGLLPVKGSGEELSVSGFASLPACCRGTRGYQYFFVNGRYVKSRTMMAALEEAYQNQKMVGRFPACVLHLATRLSWVDVNVHPTKTKVKFGSDRTVFDAVYYAVKSALEGNIPHPLLPVTPMIRPQDEVTPNQIPMEGLPSRAGQTKCPPQAEGGPSPRLSTSPVQRRPGLSPEFSGLALPLHDITSTARRALPQDSTATQRTIVSPAPERDAHRSAPPFAAPPPSAAGPWTPYISGSVPAPQAPIVERASSNQMETTPAAAPTSGEGPHKEQEPWRIAGEVLNTYLIVEQGERILLIDKHAAHERMNFDKLKAEDYQPMVQSLLAPVVFTPAAEEVQILLEQAHLLGRFGFEVEDFGGGALAVRGAPDYVAPGEIEGVLTQLAGKLLAGGRADPASARDELLHSMACKAAIKGGQHNGPEELRRVAEAVLSGAVKYCPHGRPVAVELTRRQLEKQFKRA